MNRVADCMDLPEGLMILKYLLSIVVPVGQADSQEALSIAKGSSQLLQSLLIYLKWGRCRAGTRYKWPAWHHPGPNIPD